ncbi:acyl-CoA thioesterase [Methylophaga sp. OBS1]|jgi:acyl-CoA thioesterase YciA|uniref:acyl-CoA thioesterase n=1 Tax=Methylophaga sp. OBS1 TaxID=2991933 RepID=UPI002258EE07|nr:acyl-CoA thioesterase [Methylophaga sp. OBS1]MCX4193997.1 acyl-CoA thioesterase [Methylophaga sp. OBS1]
MSHKLPDEHAILRIMARPNDVNIAGDIFGGWLMSQCDIAGGIVASRRASGRVVTVAVKDFRFIAPVLVSDIVSIYADVISVGTSSVSISIDVYVERRQAGEEIILPVAKAEIVYVHINDARQPTPID